MFRMSDNGSISFSRNGQFNLDKSGYITNSSGRRLTGYAVDATGVVVPGSFVDLRVNSANIAPAPSTSSQVQLTLDSRAAVPAVTTFSPANASSYTASTAQTVYDSLGNAHNMTMYFLKNATAGQYDMYTTLDGGTPSAASTLTFSTTGALTTVMPISESFALTNGATTPLAYTLDLTGTTQYGVDFGVNQLIQDGYTSGRLTSVSVAADGVVQGRYSNGKTQNLGQVALVNFNNPNALQQLGENQWAETSESGQPIPGSPGQGSLGAVQSGAIEESNVDLTAELVNMITQQRAYQANAQSIKTQDSVLQTLVSLR
jgi:flagellar hook protein FlgE